MGTKYLGETFDIHGGGMDLVFPHHECEIAQSTAALGHESVHYWMHNNMVGWQTTEFIITFSLLFDPNRGQQPLFQLFE